MPYFNFQMFLSALTHKLSFKYISFVVPEKRWMGWGYFFANFNPSLNYTLVIYITWIHFVKTS